ncbi:MAG: AAA family ATPase [Bacteroidales bacterium]|nr:AAA family ATPase [Bacteroidales bacterium]
MMWKIHQTYNWKELEDKFSWVHDMQNVPQDPIYHAEGNVAIHTQMVMAELQQLPEFKELDEQNQHILMAAALMHDIEKRSTTVLESDGRISSANHAKNGEHSVREILYREIETPFAIRESIAKLIRYHGQPIWLILKDNPEKKLAGISLEVDTKMLAILAKADVLGRTGAEQSEFLDRIDLFKELCVNLDCWGKPRHFKSDIAKYHYFTHNSYIDYVPFQKNSFEVVLLSALPGSGKDWYIENNLSNLPEISLDNLRRKYKASPTDQKMTGRIVQEAKELARQFLRKKQSFVWNATNLSSSLRKTLIGLFAEYGAHVKIIYLEVPYKKLLLQNQNRKYPLPQAVLDKMIKKWDVPQQWEAHNVVYKL